MMKIGTMITLTLAILALAGCGGESGGPANIYIAYEADSDRTITMAVGDELQVILAENPTTGYVWSVITNDEEVLSQTEEPSYVVESEAIGAGGERTFTFRDVAHGTSALQLINSRSWETAVTPDRTFSLMVEVAE